MDIEKRIVWTRVLSQGADTTLFRAKVPGGWLVLQKGGDGDALVFYSDPAHAWDGSSLP